METPAAPNDARAMRVVAILIWAQAVLGAQTTVHFILGGLAGALLAGNPAYATLPISLIVAGSMVSAPILSWIMGRWGRRAGFVIGAAAGALGGALAAQAIILHSFALLLVGSGIFGIYLAAHNFYRFAAADIASPAFRPRAISWVMGGGLVAALLGPQLVIWFQDALEPIPYAGAYRAMVLLNLIGVIPLLFLDLPPAPRPEAGARGRPWRAIFADPRVPVAMICAMLTYCLMNLVMTSTPLAMIACGFHTNDAAEIVRIHVLAMYAPSFFTGPLITRIGAPRVIGLGLGLLAAAGLVALSGVQIEHFAVALALIGVGWNFGFIGATTLLAGAHRPEERSRVQGLNDALVFGTVTVGSLSSGALMASHGWAAVNLAMLPALAIAAAALLWLARRPAVATV